MVIFKMLLAACGAVLALMVAYMLAVIGEQDPLPAILFTFLAGLLARLSVRTWKSAPPPPHH